ncbi:MAG: Hpt domain-containing protein [Sphingomonadaceae bacterium]|nr:Hpt domain-containing protein [Sphingomonadaceae bacterium]
MLFDNGALDATLASAAGDDPALLNELRTAFRESVARQLDLLSRSRCDGNWTMAALRLKGLAASFHASELLELAEEAISGAPGDPVILRKIATFLHDPRIIDAG